MRGSIGGLICVGLACNAALVAAATEPAFVDQAAHQQLAFQVSSSSSPSSKVYTEDYWAAEEGVGHFSEWSKAQKRRFIDVVRSGDDAAIANWTVVMGNEGGDLDSMASALAWSYHLDHIHTENFDHDRATTVALLQTPEDALDLRPENKLALSNSNMSPGHRDLLTIDELPMSAEDLSKKIKGIVIVDHPLPLSVWRGAKVLSIFDHHIDRGVAQDATPRIFERTASCSTIVARTLLNEREKMGKGKEYHVPHEMLELILAAIALDSDALSTARSMPSDVETASRLLHLSRWKDQKLQKVMARLDEQMSKAKKSLDDLSVRDLLRRDWKGDLVHTPEGKPDIHLGFASIPISLDDQIERTLHQRITSWFDIESQWTNEIGADVSVALTSFKARDPDTGKKAKRRQIVLSVRSDKNIDEQQADELFEAIKKTVESHPVLEVDPWPKANQLARRQMVWEHSVAAGGRKLVRPIIEDAVGRWGLSAHD
ncbi:DHH phosphoesterase [Tilletiaria anomala UBC 951]|uniref:DHH phosphoesterase n=1 Tax=Tilletiaria anomala (strain ATCC 24038 / CBS 436.72 / UBC 951) TaxID=1037660 RepID=A0A066WLY1_TILAU|nr:DHH phosphoesterase [Tilletiaria anomala UBC 951]KDN52004.1 DHH phosphoesterase [Tilletiaria anomala UBC 951]